MDKILKSTRVEENEIIKADDVNNGYKFAINNVITALQSILETSHNFVIGGEVTKGSGNNLSIGPVFGVNIDEDDYIPVMDLANHSNCVSVSMDNPGRIDILEIQGTYADTTTESRAKIDFDTKSKSLFNIATRTELQLNYKIKNGETGTMAAPDIDSGWIKLAEIVIPSNATSLDDCTINSVTADMPDMENTAWNKDKTATYNLKTVSSLRSIFRNQHNADGSHKAGTIGKNELNLNGTDGNKITGSQIQNGQSGTVGSKTYGSTDPIDTVLKSLADAVTLLYNAYQINGNYKFTGDLIISNPAAFDESTSVKVHSNGDGSADIYVGETKILTIKNNNILVQTTYTGSNDNSVATVKQVNAVKTIADGNTSDITKIKSDIVDLQNSGAVNQILAKYTFGQEVTLVTTENIVALSGVTESVDGITVSLGNIILVKDQTDKTQNGIYCVESAAWTRLSDETSSAYNPDFTMLNKFFAATFGATNKGKLFYSPSTTITEGETEIEFLESMFAIEPISNKMVAYDSNGGIKATNLTVTTRLTIPVVAPDNPVAGDIWLE